MSTTYDVTTDSSFTADDATFDVFTGASLGLTGSSNTVMMESGSSSATLNVTGNGNTIVAASTNGIGFWMGGAGNVATLGANTYGSDSGNGDIITLGADSIFSADGNNTTLNATAGESRISFVQADDGVANANNDEVTLCASSALVNGNANQISLAWGNDTLNLNGSNNTVTFNGAGSVVKTATNSVTEDANGSIVLAGNANLNSITLTGGVATVQLGNGNVAAISDVTSGSTIEYIASSGAVTTSILTDTDLLHMGGNLYEVTGNVLAQMDNTIFDVQSQASLGLTSSSDIVMMESGSSSLTFSGTDDTIIGSAANGVGFWMTGTGNTVTLGAHTYGSMDSGIDNTLTLGADSIFDVTGTNITISTTGGGSNISFVQANNGIANENNDTIGLCASSAQVNGNGNQINLAWGNDTLNLNGSGNQINMEGSDTLNLNGSNNTISFSASNGPEMIQTTAGDVVEEAASGAISISSGTGSYTFSITKQGFVTLGFSNGNTIQISNVLSSTNGSGTVTDNQVTQLVSAMASYSSGSPGLSSTFMAQTPPDTSLFASSHH